MSNSSGRSERQTSSSSGLSIAEVKTEAIWVYPAKTWWRGAQ